MTTIKPALNRSDEGFYGMRGWTTKLEIRSILRPYLTESVFPWLADEANESEELADYEPFHGLKASAAQRLLAVLPERNLTERQNFSPTCEAMLRAAANHPSEVELVGYAIGPARQDERVSIEGLIYYWDGEDRFNPTTQHARTRLWETIRNKLELHSATLPPDELHRFRPAWDPRREGWWVWWD
ncbi:MAG: hypothetical protein Q4P05_05255 [Actinomycetaceae bacterium]|nr:hypothetical protein [Actinomycetaceae bacterium]